MSKQGTKLQDRLARRRNDAAPDELDYLADGSDQGKKRKCTVEIFHNQTTSLSEFPYHTIDMIKNLTTNKLFVTPSVIHHDSYLLTLLKTCFLKKILKVGYL